MAQTKSIYLDHAAATPLSGSSIKYLSSLLNQWGNPSSLHSQGTGPKQIISEARRSVAKFINADKNEIFFTPSGSAGNTLAIKGIASENPRRRQYNVFYSPSAHKSMIRACKSCIYNHALKVNSAGEIDLSSLDAALARYGSRSPLVCMEAGNSEIGTINDVISAGSIVHKHNGILVVDATGYIPSYKVDMKSWKAFVDILTFSGHKLHALKGIGVLYKRKNIRLKPLIYGSQEQTLIGGTENVLGIASLGKAVDDYDYSSISPNGRDYVYNFITENIPESYLVGASIQSGKRLPHNLYMCFKGIEGESLMFLLDMNGIQVSTGSACNGHSVSAPAALSAIGMDKAHEHSCIRMSFAGTETKEELFYVCETLKQCVEELRMLNT